MTEASQHSRGVGPEAGEDGGGLLKQLSQKLHTSVKQFKMSPIFFLNVSSQC